MSALEFGKPRRRFVPGRGLVYLVLIILIIGGGYLLVPRFEWRRPQIKITPDTDTIGLAPVEIEVDPARPHADVGEAPPELSWSERLRAHARDGT